MKKKTYQKIEEFDKDFEEGKIELDFSKSKKSLGMSKMKKVAPFEIPEWLAKKIDDIAKKQGNSRSAVLRQLLSKAVNE